MVGDYQRIERLLERLDRKEVQSSDKASLSDSLGMESASLETLLQSWCGMDSRQFRQLLSQDGIRAILGRNPRPDGSVTAESEGGAAVDIQPGEASAEQEYVFQDTRFGELLVLRRIGGGISYAAFCDGADNEAALVEAGRQLASPLVRENRAIPSPLPDPDGTPSCGVPLLEPQGSEFQLRVWQALARLPVGQLISYGQLAESLGSPKSVRAVASAVARNPIACFIPCHRVVLGDGRVGQYRWGAVRKQAMLVWEQGRVQSARP